MLIENIIAWIAASIWGFIIGWLTNNALRARRLQLPLSDILPFPVRLVVDTLVMCVLSWVLFNYFSPNPGAHPWVALLPLYFLIPPFVSLMFSDARYRILPNRVMLPTAIMLLPLVSVLALVNLDIMALIRIWVLALAAGLFLGLGTLFGLGMGDVKLGVLLSAWLGLYGWFAPLVMLLIASLLGGIFALIRLASHKIDLRGTIAFGPWMITAAYITWILYLPAI